MDTDAVLTEVQLRQDSKKEESTARDYERVAREWAEWLSNPGEKSYDPNRRSRDTKELWDATSADVRRFLRQQHNSGIAPGTIRSRRWSLSALYNELKNLQEEDWDFPKPGNPAREADLSGWTFLKKDPKKKLEMDGEYYLKPEEVADLAENAPEPRLRNELIIRLLYQTGLRRGECAEITLGAVDRDKRSININSEKDYTDRTVYYQPSLDTLLSRWINVERKALATAGSRYLFPTYKTEQITPKQVSRTVKKAAQAAGIQKVVYENAAGQEQQKVTAHTLRHSFAVGCVLNDMDTRRLQRLMGHAKIETTERYLRMAQKDVREAYRRNGPPPAKKE